MPIPSTARRRVPVWAALRSLGRQGVADLVEGLARNARELAAAIGEIDGATVLNDVVYTQVCLSFGDDARTAAVTDHVIKDGTTWMSGSRWQGQQVLRISVSNWTTEGEDISRSVDAIARAVAATAG
jgi:glutamate/tyrosine decarboxylase-like PLP-dependent enzyme